MTAKSKKHLGFTIQQLRSEVNNEWELSPEAQQFMHHYFLRRWHTINLLALLKDGCLNYEGTRYQIIWQGGKVAATARDYCFLSFRKPSSSAVYPVVLVKAANAPKPVLAECIEPDDDYLLYDPRN